MKSLETTTRPEPDACAICFDKIDHSFLGDSQSPLERGDPATGISVFGLTEKCGRELQRENEAPCACVLRIKPPIESQSQLLSFSRNQSPVVREPIVSVLSASQ